MNSLILILLPCLIQVESQSQAQAVGDGGKAYGILQIWDVCVQDVNRVYGHKYTHEMMFDPRHAKNLAIYYLMHWGGKYKERTGKEPTLEVLARIWNGGPRGYEKSATDKYWLKVKKELDKIY